jgi:anti-anti-sigma factor
MKPVDVEQLSGGAGPEVVLLAVKGRLDGFGSKSFGEALDKVINDPTVTAVVLDMREVSYLSSAALRVFTVANKRLKEREGILVLAHLDRFCRDVFEISGLGAMFPMVETRAEALALCQRRTREKRVLGSWESLETWETPLARIRVVPGEDTAQGIVEILGDVKEVLHADLTESQIASKTFSETEYSIGCGALGDEVEDYYPIMGEMITIGGTMVWLPTDGNDTPDFLIPRRSSRAVTIRTGFNASITGGFHEFIMVESIDAKGLAIDQLYRQVFEAAKRRRPDFHGVVGIAGRAEFTAVYGAGIRKSPIRRFKPQNGETILHPTNINEWFSGDHEPRLQGVTGLLCGVGVDLTADLSAFDPAHVDRAFYRHPDNTAGKPHLLHNHSVFFTQQPFRERVANLASEIQDVVEQGDFRDMRHLLDQSRVNKAFLGLSYTQAIRHEGGPAA